MIKVSVTSVFVENQEAAFRFYTDVLGFILKTDEAYGEDRWLTVVSQSDPDGVELLLEPNNHPAASTYQKAIFSDGIPVISLETDNIEAESKRLIAAGVHFAMEPTSMDSAIVAMFDDTCGNLISLSQST